MIKFKARMNCDIAKETGCGSDVVEEFEFRIGRFIVEFTMFFDNQASLVFSLENSSLEASYWFPTSCEVSEFLSNSLFFINDLVNKSNGGLNDHS